MAYATFSVGSGEKHTIRVHWSLWTGRIIVLVDNSEIAKSGNAFGGEKSIRFKIGDKEEHQIEIRTSYNYMSFSARIELIVDGKSEATNI